MCQKYQDLKLYPVAITRQCMRYQNHVVSAIKPEVYETPYIGAEAYLRQLEQCRRQQEALQEQEAALEEKISQLEFVTKPLDTAADVDLKYRLPALEEKRKHEMCIRDSYNRGLHTEKNDQEAHRYYKMAADKRCVYETGPWQSLSSLCGCSA